MGKAVIAVVPGWAVGGGHSLHVVCDLTLASEEHAIFKQTDADVTSFDAGYGSAYLAKMVGQKKARESFFSGATIRPGKLLKWGWSTKWCRTTNSRPLHLNGHRRSWQNRRLPSKCSN